MMEEPAATPATEASDTAVPDSPGSVQPSLLRFAFWLLLATLLSIGLAWLSLTVQSRGLAPLILTSLVVGGSLGGLFVLLTRLTGTGSRRLIIAASLLLALVTAGMQHVFAYQAYLAGFHEAVSNNPKAALAKTFNPKFGPAGFWGYMQAEGRQHGYALMWIVDAVLILLASAAVVWLGLRRPFCTKCHCWYHVGRLGVLPSTTAVATCANLGIALPADLAMAGYRLLECQRGCSPAELEVSWTTAAGAAGSQRATLDAAGRSQFETAVNLVAKL
jgi:hypothetical protein